MDSAILAALEIIISRMGWQRGWFCPSVDKKEQGVHIISAYANGYECGIDYDCILPIWEELYKEKLEFALLHEYDIVSENVRRYMINKGVKRILYYPITQNARYAGCVVFEDCNTDTPEIHMGKPCYKMICGRDTVCEDCIMKKLNKEDKHSGCSGEAFNLSIRTWTKQSACWFTNRKDSLVCMITGTDISEYFIG